MRDRQEWIERLRREAYAPYGTLWYEKVADALESAEAEIERLSIYKKTLKEIEAHQPTVAQGWSSNVDEWGGDCCYGNYDDAHCHGRALGHQDMARIAAAALAQMLGEGRMNKSALLLCEKKHCPNAAVCFYEDRNGIKWQVCVDHAKEYGFSDADIARVAQTEEKE